MKKLLFALLITILSISMIGCMSGDGTTSESESLLESESFIQTESDPSSDPESNPESNPESDPESNPESDPESNPESDFESDPESDLESEIESEPESEPDPVEVRIVTVNYKLTYNGESLTVTYEVEVGKSITITLPTIPEDSTSDYAFNGWEIVETGEKYGKDVTTITLTVDSDITIRCTYSKQYTGNY